jgi:hypothetical protein
MDIYGPWQKILKISFVDNQPLAPKRPPTFIIRLRQGRRCGAALISPRQPAQRSERTAAPVSAFPLSAFPPTSNLFQIFNQRPLSRGQTARHRACVAASRKQPHYSTFVKLTSNL